MATTIKGRGGSRSRSGYGSHSGYSFDHGQSGWNKGGTTTTTTGRKTSKRTTSVGCASGYKGCCTNFERKFNSYKMLWNQTKGSATCARPTPTVLNSFANWINKGAIIQMCTPAQVSRWARSANKNFNSRSATPTSCKNVLAAKFGKSTIKAVCRTKTGSFMVATTPTCKGKSFCFPR